MSGPESLSLKMNLYVDLPPGTVVDIAITGCGGERVKETFGDAMGGLYPLTYSDGVPAGAGGLFGGLWEVDGYTGGPLMGPDWTGVMSIARPGFETWVWNFTHDGFDFKDSVPYIPLPTNDDTCAGAEPTTISVSKWSTKKGNTVAKVGKTLKVTPTRAAGAKVSYAWKAGRKVVDRNRAMTVKKSYKGKKVTMKVTVTKAGAKTVSKTLRYGLAR